MKLDYAFYLNKALTLAEKSRDQNNIPIGSIIINESGEILAEGHNSLRVDEDLTALAEIVAIRNAGRKVIKKYSPQPTILITTVEPCIAGAYFIPRTNIKTIVWALNDRYKGGIELLIKSEKFARDFEGVSLLAELVESCREESQRLMREYYLQKGMPEVARLFTNLPENKIF